MSEEPVRLSVSVQGRVQGVGFRCWVRGHARELGLSGSAVNLMDGRVEIVVEGPQTVCEQLLALVDRRAPRGRGGAGAPGRVDDVVPRWSAAEGEPAGFRIG